MTVRVAVGMGANLGRPEASLLGAASALERVPGIRPLALSSAYVTAPVGSDGPDYLNAVMVVETSLPALELLCALQGIEAALGRRRGERFGPRVIDLDMLLASKWDAQGRRLTVPHPRLNERAFALVPLLEVWPTAKHPVTGQRYKEVLASGVDQTGVGKRVALPSKILCQQKAHTADLAFVSRGATAEQALENAAMGLVQLCVHRTAVVEQGRRLVDVKGDGPAELLVAALSEIVFCIDGLGFVPRRCSVVSLERGRARMWVYGQKLGHKRQLKKSVKAITYHGATMAQQPRGGWRATFVADV